MKSRYITARSSVLSREASSKPPSLRPALSAFSLIELLVVIAIIMLLATLMVPAIRGMSGGINLTRAAEEMVAVENLARQRARTFNRPVAIRFWKDAGNYRSYQLWEQKDVSDMSGWTPVEGERKLPTGIIITNSDTYSSMLARAGASGTTNGRSYADALFSPAGTLVASEDQVAVTFVPEFGPQNGGVIPGLPPNFATVVIEPLNAIPTVYRPQ